MDDRPFIPLDLHGDEMLMDLWWRRARTARIDIEAEISRIADERGWSDPAEPDAKDGIDEEE